MKPKVVIHTQVSLDGRIKGFEDTGVYYRLSYQFGADMVLFGSNTVLAAAESMKLPEKEQDYLRPDIDPNDSRPFAVVADSRGRLKCLHMFRNFEFIKDVIVLISHSTPESYIEYLKQRNYIFISAGDDHVDFKKAFDVLYSEYGCRVIRTDSGGTLTNILLEQKLADEISIIVSPCLVGGDVPNMFEGLSLKNRIDLELIKSETIEGGYLSLIYRIIE